MGLDMYAWGVDANDVARFLNHTSDEPKVHVEELCYWRKHHDLHGWMERLYQLRGGTETFNCIKLRLELEDLDNLEADLKARSLPETTGFFFGNNPPDEETDSYDFEFIAKARQYIDGGGAVFYDSWW